MDLYIKLTRDRKVEIYKEMNSFYKSLLLKKQQLKRKEELEKKKEDQVKEKEEEAKNKKLTVIILEQTEGPLNRTLVSATISCSGIESELIDFSNDYQLSPTAAEKKYAHCFRLNNGLSFVLGHVQGKVYALVESPINLYSVSRRFPN